jgi:hypothetical protein
MSRLTPDKSVKSDYLRGYLQAAIDAQKTNDAPSHVELWDCATVSLTEWLQANSTNEDNRKRQR